MMNKYSVIICFRNPENQFRAETMTVEEVDGYHAKAEGWKRFVREHPDCEFVSWKAVRK